MKYINIKLVDTILAILVAISSIIFWTILYLSTGKVFPGGMFWIIWIGGFGGLYLWRHRHKVEKRIHEWHIHPLLKFLALGYGAVLLEEILAAFTNNLTEGFSLPLYFIRIGQFWAFNVLAFTGFIWGWYYLLTRLRYTRREAFYLAGLWGLYAEHLLAAAFTNITGFVVLTLPTIFTYGLILSPALLGVEHKNQQELNRPLKWILTFVVLFLCTIVPTIVLLLLRGFYPDFFPPTSFIQ